MARNALEVYIKGDVQKSAQALWDVFEGTLGQKGVRKLEQFATVNAARALAPAVRDAAPTDHGLMKKSVRGRRSRITRPGAIVGPVAGKKRAWYSWLVVRGTRPHSIPKRTATGRAALFFKGKLFQGVEHPGTKGNNFVDRAVEAHIEDGRDAFAATIVLMFQDQAFRHMVIGLDAQYKNKKAAQWQREPWGRHWKNADYVEPLIAATNAKPANGRNRSASQWAKISAAAKMSRAYKAEASGTLGVVPRMRKPKKP
jgi:hypothetical protein